jgi:S-DNA-T family DNA segregation ATPase FtsK/SpoIIIE
MLFLPPGENTPVRIQGAYISTEETERLLDWYRELREKKFASEEEGEPRAEEDILEVVRAREAEESGGEASAFDGEWDEYFREAAEVCIQNELGSTSLLQRKLRIGYGRAARIVDQLHEAGVLGPPDGSKPREILLSMDQIERMFPRGKR